MLFYKYQSFWSINDHEWTNIPSSHYKRHCIKIKIYTCWNVTTIRQLNRPPEVNITLIIQNFFPLNATEHAQFHAVFQCKDQDCKFVIHSMSDPCMQFCWKCVLESKQCGSSILSTHPFCSMSIGPPIPEIQHLQNLTLKIKVQGHGWGHGLKSQCGSNILSTHIPFVPCESALPFLSFDFFKIWPWKSKVKVMGEVTVQSHNVGLASYRLTSLSFHVNRPFHSWDTAFSIFDLENQGSRSWMRSQFKVTMWV